MKENYRVCGYNNLLDSETFSIILTAHGFLPDLGFPCISCAMCDWFIFSHLIFLLVDVNCYVIGEY